MPEQTIGQYLKSIRKSKNMTQLEVATHLNVSPQAVSKWECNDSIPDVTLLPEIARLYDITIENILSPAGKDEYDKEENYHKIIGEISTIVDSRLFQKILQEFQMAKQAKDLTIPFDVFMFLNDTQKEQVFQLLFEMKDYGIVIDDILPYTNTAQRRQIIKKVLEKQDYGNLESLIPFTSKSIRTEILKHLLEEHQFSFIEDILPFLNHEQKDMIIEYARKYKFDYNIMENYMVFFDSRQRKEIRECYMKYQEE